MPFKQIIPELDGNCHQPFRVGCYKSAQLMFADIESLGGVLSGSPIGARAFQQWRD